MGMFDNPEIKKLRQDIDALSAQIEMSQESAETRHAEVLAKIDAFSQFLRDDVESRNKEIEEALTADDDTLLERAKELVIEAGKASTSYLQRTLGIGYSRAARLIDLLEDDGVIGPGHGAKPREVIAKADEA